MPLLLLDPTWEAEILAERRDRGIDAFDEVWDGTYVVTPPKDNAHQALLGGICTILHLTFEVERLGIVYPGINISDHRDDWKQNYRCPDVVAFLHSTRAVDCHSHYFGGADFVAEIVSPHDRAWEKIPFYEKVGVQELLFIDRDPWRLTLYRLRNGRLRKVGRSDHPDQTLLRSEVLPVDWRMTIADGRAAIEILHHDGAQQWLIRG